MYKVFSKKLLFLLLPIVLIFSCRTDNNISSIKYTYKIPEQLDDGWETAALDNVGINENIISTAISNILNDIYKNVHSILIVKNGKLVLEEYFPGYTYNWSGEGYRGDYTEFDRNTIHNLMSVTKSITSALVGIAIDLGFIQDVNEKVFTYFPEYGYLNNENKDKITLEHLLTMTSGLEWNESEHSAKDLENDLIQLFFQSDPIEYILAKSVIHEPGTEFNYNSGGTNLLGEVIKKATDLSMDNFAEVYLFLPLGITEYEWKWLTPDIIFSSAELKLRPRDMAKFGLMYLQNGIFKGDQIISEDWIKESTKEYISLHNISSRDGYGYNWSLETYYSNSGSAESFFASGWGGQKIIVFPNLNMVVVFTGGNYVGYNPVDEIVTSFILPAVF